MESVDLREVERRARRAYEGARVRRSAAAFSPVLLLVVPAALIGHELPYAMALGGALFLLGVALLWYGRGIKRAVLPGVAAGLIPLVFALCAYLGQGSVREDGMMWCIAACSVGGLIAGVLIDLLYLRGTHTPGFLFAAVGVAFLTGAIGCSCAGLFGIGGLVAGLMVTSLPAFMVTAIRRRKVV